MNKLVWLLFKLLITPRKVIMGADLTGYNRKRTLFFVVLITCIFGSIILNPVVFHNIFGGLPLFVTVVANLLVSIFFSCFILLGIAFLILVYYNLFKYVGKITDETYENIEILLTPILLLAYVLYLLLAIATVELRLFWISNYRDCLLFVWASVLIYFVSKYKLKLSATRSAIIVVIPLILVVGLFLRI